MDSMRDASGMDRGIFITFEGGDGSGKSTHIRFLASVLEDHGHEVVLLREPGGTRIGEQLRSIVLDPGNEAMADECELLVYEASRAQIVSEVIRPALERGAVVVCDRYADSTIAYQAYGRGMDRMFVERANAFACQGIVPDRTILMLTGGNVSCSLARATHNGNADRLELAGEQFHERVNAGYAALSEECPDRIRTVMSDGAKSETARKVLAELSDLFPWMADVLASDEDIFASLDVRGGKRD